MLIAKVKETIKKYGMLHPGDRVLVAVSGGPDSVCLLNVLRELEQEFDLSLRIAHLDHMFRGKQSDDEAQYVADLAKQFNITAFVEAFDVPAYCRDRGLSPQEGARAVRYAFLSRIAAQVEASRIATGHTANDQAETFLMRLMRGAGVSGLSAIPPVRDTIIRPLIDITREEVMGYLRTNGIAYASDPSNLKPAYMRNRIRMEVLPVLSRFNPRIVEILASEAALLRDEDTAVETHLAGVAESMIARDEDPLFVKRNEFNALPPAFRRRLLKKFVGMAGGDRSLLSRDRIDSALSFMATACTGRTMNLYRGLAIGREYDRFVIGVKETAEGFTHTLASPGITAIPELGMEIGIVPSGSRSSAAGDKNYRWQAMFDYDKIKAHLTIRSRRPGDWFCPSGMGGKRKKLQDYFVDEKIPRRLRSRVPLLCAGDDILWVMGLRTDGRFLPGPETKNMLGVTVRGV
jgi:tRNA(Ile)-lysidine synthase